MRLFARQKELLNIWNISFVIITNRVSNRPDLGGTVPILPENPKSRLDHSRDAKGPDFEKQRSCREVTDQKIA